MPPPDPLALSDDLIVELAPLARHVQAIELLTRCGPVVEAGAAFPADVAGLAYLVYLGWLRSPLRQGRPGYEGWNLTAARARLARHGAHSLAEYGHALTRQLRVHLADLAPMDVLWWRQYQAEAAAAWPRLRRPETIEDVVAAAGMLRSWLPALRQATLTPRDTAPAADYPDDGEILETV